MVDSIDIIKAFFPNFGHNSIALLLGLSIFSHARFSSRNKIFDFV
jgi:hypothetical protein